MKSVKIPFLHSLGFVLLIGTNLLVLAGVASNRSGTPEAVIELTQRELNLPYWNRNLRDNSGLALTVTWRILTESDENGYATRWGDPAWLDENKLRELGFDLQSIDEGSDEQKRFKHPLPKEAFIVFEMDKDAYQKSLERTALALRKQEQRLVASPADKEIRTAVEMARQRLEEETSAASRLFAVDAGLDPGNLRKQYPDTKAYLIAKGVIRVHSTLVDNRKTVRGTLAGLSNNQIHVPLEHREVFDRIMARQKPTDGHSRQPAFTVRLAWGKRLEPWILSVRSGESRGHDLD